MMQLVKSQEALWKAPGSWLKDSIKIDCKLDSLLPRGPRKGIENARAHVIGKLPYQKCVSYKQDWPASACLKAIELRLCESILQTWNIS